jgi:hypothetical protein
MLAALKPQEYRLRWAVEMNELIQGAPDPRETAPLLRSDTAKKASTPHLAERSPKAPSAALIRAGLAVVFVLLYLRASIEAARKSPLEVDEVFVMWIVHYFPGWRVMDALRMGLDSLPPAYYWLAQACSALLGQTPLAIRLPAILGFSLFPLSVFWLLCKRVDWRIAGAAMFFTTVSSAAWASTMGRPYGIVVGGFSVAAAAWVDLPQSRHRILRCFLIAAGLAVGLAVHFLAIYEVAALAVAEVIRSRSMRQIRWDCWIALVGGSATLLLWLPLIAPIYRSTHVSVHSPGFYAKPTLGRLFGFLVDILTGSGTEQIELVLLSILVPLVLVSASGGGRGAISEETPGADEAVGGRRWRDLDILVIAAFTLPVIAYVATFWVGSFNERYFIAAALGVTLLLARGLDALPWGAKVAWAVLIVSAMRLLSAGALSQSIDPRTTMVENAPESLPILVASGSDFFYLSEALPSSKLQRIGFAGMPPGSSSPDTEPEIIAGRWKAAVPSMQIDSWEGWVGRHKTFYVLSSSDPREGLTDWLSVHEHPVLVAHAGRCWLFKVTLNDGSAETEGAKPSM